MGLMIDKMTSASVHLYPIDWKQSSNKYDSHPILTKLGIKFDDLTIQPNNISGLDDMIFFKCGNNGFMPRVMVTRGGKASDDFYLAPNSVENIHVDDDEVVKVKAIVELNTIFDLKMKAGDVLILNDSFQIVEHTNMRSKPTTVTQSQPDQSHPVLTKLGVKFGTFFPFPPKDVSDLDRMIFFKNGASAGWAISVWLTRENGTQENFYLMPNSMNNAIVDDKTVRVRGLIELNTIFDRQMKGGDVLVLDDRLKIVE